MSAREFATEVAESTELTFRHLVDTGSGSGIILSTRDDSPGVLGFGAVDSDGFVTLALSVDEAMELRDALDAWLGEL